MNHAPFIAQLPQECQDIAIEPRHKIALKPFFLRDCVWVVLLTDMPEDADKAWRLTWHEWRSIEPKHETKLRWIRENLTPHRIGTFNPSRPVQTELSLF